MNRHIEWGASPNSIYLSVKKNNVMLHDYSLNEPCKPESGKSQLQNTTECMNCTKQAAPLRQKVGKWWYKAEGEGQGHWWGAVTWSQGCLSQDDESVQLQRWLHTRKVYSKLVYLLKGWILCYTSSVSVTLQSQLPSSLACAGLLHSLHLKEQNMTQTSLGTAPRAIPCLFSFQFTVKT